MCGVAERVGACEIMAVVIRECVYARCCHYVCRQAKSARSSLGNMPSDVPSKNGVWDATRIVHPCFWVFTDTTLEVAAQRTQRAPTATHWAARLAKQTAFTSRLCVADIEACSAADTPPHKDKREGQDLVPSKPRRQNEAAAATASSSRGKYSKPPVQSRARPWRYLQQGSTSSVSLVQRSRPIHCVKKKPSFLGFFKNGWDFSVKILTLFPCHGPCVVKPKIVAKWDPSVSNSAWESIFQMNVDFHFTGWKFGFLNISKYLARYEMDPSVTERR